MFLDWVLPVNGRDMGRCISQTQTSITYLEKYEDLEEHASWWSFANETCVSNAEVTGRKESCPDKH